MKKKLSVAVFAAFIYILGISAFAQTPEIISESAVVIDADTAQVLYNKNANEKMFPASTTKIMTGLLAVEKGNMSDVCTVSRSALDYKPKSASNIALSQGEEITLEALMYALAIESANDAANVIAEKIAGTQDEFAKLMTRRAKELGANNTNFVNANGLHDDNHYTTAFDLALIARECIKHESFNTIFSTEKYTVPATNKQIERTFNSANWFINGADNYEGIVMSKIGWTDEAMHTMVTACRKGDKTLICVVMKSSQKKNKWDDTETLFNWVDETFHKVDFSDEYLLLSLPEEIPIDGNENMFIKREDMSCQGVSVLMTGDEGVDDVQLISSNGIVIGDGHNASVTISLSSDGTTLATTTAVGTVTEKISRPASTPVTAPVNMVSDIVMSVIFAVLTFTALMICDILINKRV